jgi:hypothetical protein
MDKSSSGKAITFLNRYLGFSFLASFIVVGFALIPQVELWYHTGDNYHGLYSVIDYDEPFFAGYIQSLIDGKPFRNSPLTGIVDTPESPQKPSYLSIQIASSYPLAFIATSLGLSVSTTMILALVVFAFLSSSAVFWLFYMLEKDLYFALIGTLIVLFFGALVGGQGGLASYFWPEHVQYSSSLLFLRRPFPATTFPILFFFVFLISRVFAERVDRFRIVYFILAICAFALLVFSYFYLWTTAFAWYCAFLLVWAIFRYSDFVRNLKYIALVTLGLFAVLIPYGFAILELIQAETVSDSLFLTRSRVPELFWGPELISYATLTLLLAGKMRGLIDFRESKILFLLSLSLVAPIVFNQQVLTGRVLQSFHYAYFASNYISLFAFITVAFVLIKRSFRWDALPLAFLCSVLPLTALAFFDAILGSSAMRPNNIVRNDLYPIAEAVRNDNRNPSNRRGALMAFDFWKLTYVASNEFPGLSSQPVLWSPHLAMFPDVNEEEKRRRLFLSLYYHGFDGTHLRQMLSAEAVNEIHSAVFGFERVSKIYKGRVDPIATDEIDRAVEEFDYFRSRFDSASATNPELAYVVVDGRLQDVDFTFVDRWYERDEGEKFGNFTFYRTKIRTPDGQAR